MLTLLAVNVQSSAPVACFTLCAEMHLDCPQICAGTKLELFHGVTLLRLGGHFPGSSVLHWAGSRDRASGGLLLTGAACPAYAPSRH